MNWYDGLQEAPVDVQRLERPFRWLSGRRNSLMRRSMNRCNYGYLGSILYLMDMTAIAAMHVFGGRKK
jgi:hypothetical protein